MFFILRKGKVLRKHSLPGENIACPGKIAASVLLKLFINNIYYIIVYTFCLLHVVNNNRVMDSQACVFCMPPPLPAAVCPCRSTTAAAAAAVAARLSSGDGMLQPYPRHDSYHNICIIRHTYDNYHNVCTIWHT